VHFIDGADGGYAFTVNAFGVQGDSLLTGGGGGGGGNDNRNRGPGGGDPSWDALFFSAGTLVEDGWTAEIRIPFKSLRYPARGDGTPHRWGFQLQRESEPQRERGLGAGLARRHRLSGADGHHRGCSSSDEQPRVPADGHRRRQPTARQRHGDTRQLGCGRGRTQREMG
jgi:hypothetical protein